ncbi:MAG: hypothetical protein AAGD11_07795 [Planctomycetota bacterium]
MKSAFAIRTAQSAARAGISLIEVLISMFVLLFGLMGVAAIFPVGNHYVVEGEKFDLGAAVAQNAFEELKARGLLRPEFWHYADRQGNLVSHTRTEDFPNFGEFETQVIQPATLRDLVDPSAGNPQGANPDRGEFNLIGSIGSQIVGQGYAFILDPLGTASSSAANLDIIPNSYLNTVNIGHQWDEAEDRNGFRLALSGIRWPVRRITVPDTQVPMRTEVAETIFRLRDDLAVEQPDETDIPSQQRWDTADVDLAGDPNNTPDDQSDDQLLRRQYKGDYSWFASIVPTTNQGLLALQPASEDYGEIACDVSVVVFRKRVFEPSAESERRIDAELLQGGELVVYSTNSNQADQRDEVDDAVEGIRPGNWICLMGVNQTGDDGSSRTDGEFVMKWYRVLSIDDETSEIQIATTGSQEQGRRLMLVGPDWPAVPVPGSPGVFLPYIPNLQAGFFPGAISVVTKPMRMEGSSLWELE